MQYCDITIIVSLLACVIAKDKTSDEISLLSAVFTQLGDTLDTILAQEAICSSSKDTV